MNDKTKKWLIVIGCLVLCAALVAGISHQFRSEEPVNDSKPELPVSSQADDLTVDTDVQEEKDVDVVVVPPDTTLPENTDNGAVSSGTEQTIQGDVSKPEYTEEQLRNPDQKPNGEKAAEEDEGDPSENTPETDNQPQGGDTKDGQIYVPGFGWITDNGGGGQGSVADDMYENGNKIGTM